MTELGPYLLDFGLNWFDDTLIMFDDTLIMQKHKVKLPSVGFSIHH